MQLLIALRCIFGATVRSPTENDDARRFKFLHKKSTARKFIIYVPILRDYSTNIQRDMRLFAIYKKSVKKISYPVTNCYIFNNILIVWNLLIALKLYVRHKKWFIRSHAVEVSDFSFYINLQRKRSPRTTVGWFSIVVCTYISCIYICVCPILHVTGTNALERWNLPLSSYNYRASIDTARKGKTIETAGEHTPEDERHMPFVLHNSRSHSTDFGAKVWRLVNQRKFLHKKCFFFFLWRKKYMIWFLRT